MIVIRRRSGEKIYIDTDQGRIVVTALKNRRGERRIGIETPLRSMIVKRAELDGVPIKPKTPDA